VKIRLSLQNGLLSLIIGRESVRHNIIILFTSLENRSSTPLSNSPRQTTKFTHDQLRNLPLFSFHFREPIILRGESQKSFEAPSILLKTSHAAVMHLQVRLTFYRGFEKYCSMEGSRACNPWEGATREQWVVTDFYKKCFL